jgi:hypothetical protein
MSNEIEIADDFIKGARDCRKGKEAQLNASDDYNRGYNAEYALEQAVTHFSERQEGIH